MRLSKIVLGVFLALSFQAHAEKVDINFNNLNISDAIKMVGKITGKNILIDGEIKGKINFVSNEPVEKSQLIPIINAILATKKMTLVPKGDYLQVVKMNDASGEGLPVRSNISKGGTMETVIFQLKSVNTAVIRTKIKPLLHKSAKVVSFKKNNLLAITAYPHTLKSIKKLIDKIERGEQKKSRIITLQHALVKDIFSNIQSMSKELFAQDIISERVSVMKDDSSNSIILVGNSRNLNRLVKYIEQLDIEGEERDVQRMYVIPLQNSNVEDMEKILSKILPQMTGNLARGGSIHAIAKGQKIPPTHRNASGMNRSPIAKNGKVQKAVIASDLERNALIVLANSAQIENIRETVKLLDIEKSQVYIKAKIVEVNTNLAENIGVKYGFSGGAITSNGVFSLLASSGAAPLAISSELMGFLNQGGTKTIYNDAGNAIGTETNSRFAFDSGIKEVFSTGIQLDLLKQNGAAQVLSEPSVLCTNNKASSIYVGQTQSIITQSQQSTQGSSNVLNNYSREDIGITLNVKPRLSSNNKVSLEVETTIEDVLPGSGAAADRPTTTKRSVKTNAIVNHGETIILGGLIKTSTGKSSTRVPILGDIPILGRLFTSQGEAKNKINVVIYLTPYIIKKSSDLKTLRKNLDELDSIQQKFNKIVLDKLEKRRLGITEDRRHVTFSSQSKNLLKVTPDETPKSNIENYIPAEIESEVYEDDSPVIRSESILDSINQQDRDINLNEINTGIEYHEGTTF
ncbi:General secretion pathway protein D / Type II secretion outermembrane pore forming protein (PulD) [hydrothermal vent metagenome]|uniref:General secretion pathway protein D / Type II secretion outermembrane pore forming protein (PulD) n=1 Tax=hydrothermal vent metagenome TaxID=652676 RepID=A0A1W1C307_9ZZZZ